MPVYELAGNAASVEELLVGWLERARVPVRGERWCSDAFVFPEWSRTSYRADLHGEPADPSATGCAGL